MEIICIQLIQFNKLIEFVCPSLHQATAESIKIIPIIYATFIKAYTAKDHIEKYFSEHFSLFLLISACYAWQKCAQHHAAYVGSVKTVTY